MNENIDNSIQDFGLVSIQNKFTPDKLMERIRKARDVTMLVIRNATFFRKYAPELKEQIVNNDLHLTLLMLNPSSFVPQLLMTKFYDTTRDGLSKSIKDVINLILKQEIYDKLPNDKKDNLTIRLSEIMPVYSAYVFDYSELWFIPYFFRPSRMPVPVFILKGEDKLKKNEIFRDIEAMINKLTFSHDLKTMI